LPFDWIPISLSDVVISQGSELQVNAISRTKLVYSEHFRHILFVSKHNFICSSA
jgi:hypothetical protein